VVYTVTGVSADDATSRRLDNLLYLVSDLAICNSRLADSDSLIHGFLGDGDQVC